MSRDIFTLSLPTYAARTHGEISPSVMLVCGLSYALAVSLSDEIFSLVIASVLPIMIFKRNLLRELFKLNIINCIMIFTLALTWPKFLDGIFMGIIIAWRVNLIFIFFAVKIFPLGISGIYEALYSLGLPEKLRVLIILTLRGIFIMHERFNTALICVKLRAPSLKGLEKFRVFACVLGSVLLQSASRSEKMMLAVKTRGGFAGFSQSKTKNFSSRDVIACVMCACYVITIMIF